jgi:hypothetical protein
MIQVGTDMAQLLAWVGESTQQDLGKGEKVQLLQRVWKENFQLDTNGQLQSLAAQPPGAVRNPHDPEAQWATKGHKEHIGYKVQVAETVTSEPLEQGEPTKNFITAMATQPALGSDEVGLPLVEQEQAQMGLEKPTHWYVDAAYVSAKGLAQAQSEGREIIGPAQSAPKKEGRFSVEDFQINVEERKAICPAGKENMRCGRVEGDQTHPVSYRFEWSSHCHHCSLRAQCLGKGQRHRIVAVGVLHTHLQARRLEQRTQEFKEKARLRNAIEGTQSELVRAHGLRCARYRGLNKARLQNYLAGAACNIKRWIRREIWHLQQTVGLAVEEAMTAVG